MYKIVNYDWFWSYDVIFHSFKEAFKEYEAMNLGNEKSNKIVHFNGIQEEVVYCPTWLDKVNIMNEIPTNILLQ